MYNRYKIQQQTAGHMSYDYVPLDFHSNKSKISIDKVVEDSLCVVKNGIYKFEKPLNSSAINELGFEPYNNAASEYYRRTQIEEERTNTLLNHSSNETLITSVQLGDLDIGKLLDLRGDIVRANKSTIAQYQQSLNGVQLIIDAQPLSGIDDLWRDESVQGLSRRLIENNRRECDSWSVINAQLDILKDESVDLALNEYGTETAWELTENVAMQAAFLMENYSWDTRYEFPRDSFLETVVSNPKIQRLLVQSDLNGNQEDFNLIRDFIKHRGQELEAEIEALILQELRSNATEHGMDNEELEKKAISMFQAVSPTLNPNNMLRLMEADAEFADSGRVIDREAIPEYLQSHPITNSLDFKEWLEDRVDELSFRTAPVMEPAPSELGITITNLASTVGQLSTFSKKDHVDLSGLLETGLTSNKTALQQSEKQLGDKLVTLTKKIANYTKSEHDYAAQVIYKAFRLGLMNKELEAITIDRVTEELGGMPNQYQSQLLALLNEIKECPVLLSNQIRFDTELNDKSIKAVLVPLQKEEEQYLDQLFTISKLKAGGLENIIMYDPSDEFSRNKALNYVLEKSSPKLEYSVEHESELISTISDFSKLAQDTFTDFPNIKWEAHNSLEQLGGIIPSVHSETPFVISAGKIYFNFESLQNKSKHSAKVTMAEAITHLGLQKMMGAYEYAKTMERVWKNMDEESRKRIGAEFSEFDSDTFFGKRQLAEKWLAQEAADMYKDNDYRIPKIEAMHERLPGNIINTFEKCCRDLFKNVSRKSEVIDVDRLVCNAFTHAGEFNSVIDGVGRLSSQKRISMALQRLEQLKYTGNQPVSSPAEVKNKLGMINVDAKVIDSSFSKQVEVLLNNSKPGNKIRSNNNETKEKDNDYNYDPFTR